MKHVYDFKANIVLEWVPVFRLFSLDDAAGDWDLLNGRSFAIVSSFISSLLCVSLRMDRLLEVGRAYSPCRSYVGTLTQRECTKRRTDAFFATKPKTRRRHIMVP